MILRRQIIAMTISFLVPLRYGLCFHVVRPRVRSDYSSSTKTLSRAVILKGARPFRSSTTRFMSTSNTTSETTEKGVETMRAGEIKKELESYGISTKSFLEKKELVAALEKARAEGLKPKSPTGSTSSSTSTSSTSDTSSDTGSSSSSGKSREERLEEETALCREMKASELKKELEERGVSTKSFFEKSEFVKALAEARVDGVAKKNDDSEGYAEYTNVEVVTDDAGPRQKRSEQQQQQQQQQPSSGNPFGGGSPFGGGIGGMGNIADLLKNMGGGGGASPFGAGGANPFGGAGGNPFGGMGGMGDAMGKAQELMKNPKVRDLMVKAQSNPRIMSKINECMGNPAAFAKYQNDPEVADLIAELKKYL